MDFCSICANSGVAEQVVKEWLSHANRKMIRRYYHLHDEEAQKQMRRFDFLGNVDGNFAADENNSLGNRPEDDDA